MNHRFKAFVDDAKRRAVAAGVRWQIRPGADGRLPKEQRWDLSAMVRAPPPRALLSDLGTSDGCLAVLNRRRTAGGQAAVTLRPLSRDWQALIKAAVLDQLLVRGNAPRPLTSNVVTPLRILGTCADAVEPWDLTPDHVRFACEIATEAWPSGRYAELIEGVVRALIDRNHLADRSPLVPARRSRAEGTTATKRREVRPSLRKRLAERKTPEKLPEEKALWELVRIVFTETPRTFMDVIRFAQCRVLLLCGFRIEEVCALPADWRRTREYFDMEGRPAGEIGGVSRSLMVRHFAEKQRREGQDGVERHEAFQYVPEMFEEIVESTLEHVRTITEPLRKRLRAQTETGRVFPEHEPSELIPATEFFVRLLGTLHLRDEPLPPDLVEKYVESWDPKWLDAIRSAQARSHAPERVSVKTARSKLQMRTPLPPALNFKGEPWTGRERVPWSQSRFRVADLERWVLANVPTKLPDKTPLRLAGGREVYPHEMLFLQPKRSLLEGREGGILDLGMYFSVGLVDPADLTVHLGANDDRNLFRRYGRTDEDRSLSLNSHSLRHMQNTELLSHGISDLIITKRFGRRSVPQTYEYDHRSLAEELDAMELPPGAKEALGQKAERAFKLIAASKTSGPLVDEFRRLQQSEGDAAAFEFLRAEADGFHATPYGYCVNSFTVDPCPKHLECFNGCRHLALSDVAEHRRNLERVRDRLAAALAAIEQRPAGSIGRENQIQHTRTRLDNVKAMLDMAPGTRPFPEGPDRSEVP
jgi:hypothetical protein